MSGGFLGSATLDIAIGLAFIYLLLALMCTTANEWIAGIFRRRAKLLERGIRQLLAGRSQGDPALVEAFYDHPLIRGLMRDGKHPSYLPSRAFASAVIDLILAGSGGSPDFKRKVEELPESNLKRAIIALTRFSGTDPDEIHRQISAWYEDAMDRVSGWYKKETQIWTILVALFLTVAMDADTIQITRRLATDPVLRATIVERAQERAAAPRPSISVDYKDPDDPMNPSVSKLDPNRVSESERALLGQLVGWEPQELGRQTTSAWILRIIGWLLTCIAVSLGAPFWFDVLNKFINIRNAGKSPDEKAKEPEKKKLPPADRTP
jgi:hypothetical protein